MAIEIRTAKYDDIISIIDCRREFISEVTGCEMTCEVRETTTEYLKKHINSDSLICYLAIEDNRIISTVILCMYNVIPKLNNITGKVGYIFNVYTLKEYRGRGLAKELMNKTVETAKSMGVKEIYLNGEEKAIPLYRRLGFECVNREMVLRFK
jgi:ribosomal protein S18 acetylase RimI-like enzyme